MPIVLPDTKGGGGAAKVVESKVGGARSVGGGGFCTPVGPGVPSDELGAGDESPLGVDG